MKCQKGFECCSYDLSVSQCHTLRSICLLVVIMSLVRFHRYNSGTHSSYDDVLLGPDCRLAFSTMRGLLLLGPRTWGKCHDLQTDANSLLSKRPHQSNSSEYQWVTFGNILSILQVDWWVMRRFTQNRSQSCAELRDAFQSTWYDFTWPRTGLFFLFGPIILQVFCRKEITADVLLYKLLWICGHVRNVRFMYSLNFSFSRLQASNMNSNKGVSLNGGTPQTPQNDHF